MGASESSLSSTQRAADEITTVSEQFDVADPILEKLKYLKITTPILTSVPAESSLTDILEEIENKIEVSDALAVKLLQRFNYSVSAMKTASQHLSEVHALQVDIGELKGRLTEVISNCDALCKRIDSEGPEALRSSIKPFAIATAGSEINSSSSSVPRDSNQILPCTKEQS